MSPSKTDNKYKLTRQAPLCLYYGPAVGIISPKSESYLLSTRNGAQAKTEKVAGVQNNLNEISRWKLPCRGERERERSTSSSDETPLWHTMPRPSLHHTKIAKKKHLRAKPQRFGKELVPHLRSHLISTSVQIPPSSLSGSSLTNVLETITDAWPSNKNLDTPREDESEMKENGIRTFHNMERRRSVPEEIIRKFSVSHEKTSESETNLTMPDITPPTSHQIQRVQKKIKHAGKEAAVKPRTRNVLERSFRVVDDPGKVRSAEEGSSDSDSDAAGLERLNTIKRAPLRKTSIASSSLPSIPNPSERASQVDYNRTGHGIIKSAAQEKASQTGRCSCHVVNRDSETTPSARDESESGETSETISSPRMCTHPLSSSENQSSDSEIVYCNCAEIVSSRGTSTDPNRSGKSTLSQTVTDKNTSTQDSTMSVNSISSRGSTITAATDSSSTEPDPGTSAKETTTENDQSPRRAQGGRENNSGGDKPLEPNKSPNREQRGRRDRGQLPGQPHHPGRGTRQSTSPKERKMKLTHSCLVQTTPLRPQPVYEWSQLSQEEINLVQEQRKKRFQENERCFESPLANASVKSLENRLDTRVTTGSCYVGKATDLLEGSGAVPRYSAMPRTMSMVVNASSFEANDCSDSDGQSLADSLEDDPQCYYDTKQELKPVRGEVYAGNTGNKRRKEPKGRAYFVSIENDGMADLGTSTSTSSYKIPELPEELRNKIQQRHDSLHKKHENRRAKASPIESKGKFQMAKRRYRAPKLKKIKEDEGTKSTTPSKNVDLKNQKEQRRKSKIKLKNRCNGTKKEEPAENIMDNNATKKTPRFVSKLPTPINKSPSIEIAQKLSSPILSSQGEEQKIKKATYDPQESIAHKNEHLTEISVKSAVADMMSHHNHLLDVDELTKHRLSLISSLEATASMLKSQDQLNIVNSTVQTSPMRSQAIMKRPVKFRQRFEVIPEERSSSMSSAEECLSEKNRRCSLPVKLSSNASPKSQATAHTDGKSFRRYTLGSLSNFVIAKLMGRPLQAIPCVQRGPNNENQQIIIFSPKEMNEPNLSKGRDALLAMNRDEFERLSKGWMNFYLLKESSDSDDEIDSRNGEQYTQNLDRSEHQIIPKNVENTTLVYRLPSIEKDPPTTSGSATDDTQKQLGPNSPKNVKVERSYSLTMTNSEGIFQLEENPQDEHEISKIPEEVKAQRNISPDIIYSSAISKTAGKNETSSSHNCPENRGSDKKNKNSIRCSDEKETKRKVLTREVSTSTEKLHPVIKESVVELSAPTKLNSSNTVLKPKVEDQKTSRRTCSLPEVRVPSVDGPSADSASLHKPSPSRSKSLVESLPRVPGAAAATSLSDTDSDATVYMNVPSPQLPRLPLEDCGCSSDDSSSGIEERTKAVPYRERPHIPLRRRPLPFRPKHRYGFYESVHGKKPGTSGWSVTVEGTIAFPRARPDVQMRLSFPDNQGPPTVSQSDSGFVEERGVKARTTERTTGQQKQQWTVTVKNPQSMNGGKEKPVCHLPNLAQSHKVVRGSKVNRNTCELNQVNIERRLSTLWPKVREIIQNELESIGWCDPESYEEPPLSVEGRAMPFDTKPRVQRNSEKDLTRRSTERTGKLT